MADGELGAVFKGLAEDADDAGGKIANSAARIAEDAADKEDGNLADTLADDAQSADKITAAGNGEVPPEDAAPSTTPEEQAPPGEPAAPTPTYTEPSGTPDPNATPGGRVTRIGADNDAATTRSLQRENESAATLAKAGYDVEQNPNVPGNLNPDYKVEGEVFDNYAPSTANPRNIASEIQGKVDRGQADRIVLNLTDSNVDLGKLTTQLTDWPIQGLKEITVIDKQGNVVHFYP
ncbi:MAG TPA: hypothetical protein VHW44_02345 [Pseudonocardiaceae bacterium]|jgi:hypothetical protein|nr:hypothetical protein [Pseudonocardiaceae bacterium]